MGEYTLRIRRSAVIHVTVDVPDGSTSSQVEALVEDAVAGASIDDADYVDDDVEWDGPEPELPQFGTVGPIPDYAWIDVDGIRWATTSHVAVREGSPVPAFSHSQTEPEWIRADRVGDEVADLVRRASGWSCVPHAWMRVHSSYWCLVDGANVSSESAGSLSALAVAARRGGELVAVVACLAPGYDKTDSAVYPGEGCSRCQW